MSKPSEASNAKIIELCREGIDFDLLYARMIRYGFKDVFGSIQDCIRGRLIIEVQYRLPGEDTDRSFLLPAQSEVRIID